MFVSDPGGHSVGIIIPDRWWQRSDPDGHRLKCCALPRTTAQSSRGQSSSKSYQVICQRVLLLLCSGSLVFL